MTTRGVELSFTPHRYVLCTLSDGTLTPAPIAHSATYQEEPWYMNESFRDSPESHGRVLQNCGLSHLPLAINWSERLFYNLRSTTGTLGDEMLFYSQRNVKKNHKERRPICAIVSKGCQEVRHLFWLESVY